MLYIRPIYMYDKLFGEVKVIKKKSLPFLLFFFLKEILGPVKKYLAVFTF